MADEPKTETTSISTWDAIKAVIVAVPKILDFFNKIGKQISEQKFQDFMKGLDEATQKLENAKTLQERIDAAKKLSDSFAKL